MDEPNSTAVNPPAPTRKSNIIWIVVLVILAVMVCACLAVILLLAVLGPTVGNVFSNIILTVEPVP
jgi:flagellar basal body-associated protein FliL